MSPGPGLQRTILPMGFLASGINSGVRRYRPDVGLIISEIEAVAAGVFTLNECKAAPVVYCQNILPSTRIRALVTNSGQANAATGSLGVENNLKMVNRVAQELGVAQNQVLVASTGVIGVQLAVDKINEAIPELVERASQVAENFALAILTTDLVPKTVTTTVSLSQGVVRITGICKGSGMIHPNMATMLGYILTDVVLSPELAQSLLKEATDLSFNMISVDGDCSTNDCNFLIANGASEVEIKNAEDLLVFKKALIEVSQFLAQSIAADGEGANKLIEVQMLGAPDLEVARRAARGITLSPLIKTAIHGEDPNWGRILARLGAERVPSAALDLMSLRIQGVLMYEQGQPKVFDREALRQKLKQPKVKIEIDLKSGVESATAWGCDLSKRYVEINTEYS
ncbi:MAG: bifunctional glutamate N-acetyltransferase/amino-acid acetyltransferase ArgJ [Bdellovibrionales bacterium]|jgi:glutamate N-acetyltransferase/amino-acid N-acetyltransferase|nr:bifunctional glutamate N-acetyltransferase/amino-acid acetyltransferase ArgJ [Bdellovibrionales bacterium]